MSDVEAWGSALAGSGGNQAAASTLLFPIVRAFFRQAQTVTGHSAVADGNHEGCSSAFYFKANPRIYSCLWLSREN